MESVLRHPSVILTLLALAAGLVSFVRQRVRRREAANWPVTEGTIQSVSKVVVSGGRSSDSVDIGDFSYTVNSEYYSGRLTISHSFLKDNGSTRGLVHQKIQVHYDPRKPEKSCIFPQEVGGFSLNPYDQPLASDVDPIVLNIG
jgi:Protein of unknown function (DUF3592)